MRSCLAPLIADTPDARELASLRAAAWKAQGVICVSPAEIPDEDLRQRLIAYANRRFGNRQ